MKSRKSQLGLTLWSGLYLFGSIAFIVLCGIKIGPLYLNEFTVNRAVRDVAAQASVIGSEVDVAAVRSSLQKRWDIDYIDPARTARHQGRAHRRWPVPELRLRRRSAAVRQHHHRCPFRG